jgi:hypothetical protein
MATNVTTRDYIDLPEWRVLSQPLTQSTLTTNGGWMAEDFRNNDYSSSLTYYLTGNNLLNAYNAKLDGFVMLNSGFSNNGTFGTGSCAVFVPSMSPRGTILAGSTDKIINLGGFWNAPASATWTRSGSIITVTTSVAHNLASSMSLFLQASSDVAATGALSVSGAASTGVANLKLITVTTATQFTFTGLLGGALSGTLTIGPYPLPNKLTNRGDGKGFIIRIIGNASSGKTEERHITANTLGAQPIITLDEPLSFTPAAGDTFEMLSGSLLALNTGASSTLGVFRRFDVATSFAVNLNTTNMPATIPATSNVLIALDEGYVPSDRNAYEGYIVGTATYDTSNTLTGGTKKCLQATATGATSLTGQLTGGDAVVAANQFRNFQIRIVEDTVTPSAVGQRRRIVSHTVGASPVYTVAAWTVTPSANCKYVIENWTDNVLYFSGGATTMYNYTHTNYSGVGSLNTWDLTTWAAKPNTSQAQGAYIVHAFGIPSTHPSGTRNSLIYLFRVSNNFDLFDIAAGATGVWTQNLLLNDFANFAGESQYGVNDLSTMSYNPHNQEGRYLYFYSGLNNSTTSQQRPASRLDLISYRVDRLSGVRIISGQSTINSRYSCISVFQDGATKIAFWNCIRPLALTEFWQLPLYK